MRPFAKRQIADVLVGEHQLPVPTSIPFLAGERKRSAVKVIDQRANEVM